jgi:hypothetical protein
MRSAGTGVVRALNCRDFAASRPLLLRAAATFEQRSSEALRDARAVSICVWIRTGGGEEWHRDKEKDGMAVDVPFSCSVPLSMPPLSLPRAL